jgi:hypothetical protein
MSNDFLVVHRLALRECGRMRPASFLWEAHCLKRPVRVGYRERMVKRRLDAFDVS